MNAIAKLKRWVIVNSKAKEMISKYEFKKDFGFNISSEFNPFDLFKRKIEGV